MAMPINAYLGKAFKIMCRLSTSAKVNTTGVKNASAVGQLRFTTDTKVVYIFDGTLNREVTTIRTKTVHTGTGSTDASYTQMCDSATAFTLTVVDGTTNGQEMRIENRGVGKVTLSGKVNPTTALTYLVQGESTKLVWDVTDDEWQ